MANIWIDGKKTIMIIIFLSLCAWRNFKHLTASFSSNKSVQGKVFNQLAR